MDDVIIIGAGISGLSAAYTLLKKDSNTSLKVIEAKERVGGRTFATELKSADGVDVWDLGGQWVGSCQKDVMKIVQELGLDVYKQYTEGIKVQQLGHTKVQTYKSDIPRLSTFALIDLHFFMKRIEWQRKLVPVSDPNKCPYVDVWDSVTTDSMCRRCLWTQGAREVFAATMRTTVGAELSQFSWLYFLHFCNAADGIEPLISAGTTNSAQEFKIKGGAYQISQTLVKHIGDDRIVMNQPVLRIEQDDTSVTVITPNDAYKCKRLIMAVPPHQAVKVNYQPCLPSAKQLVLNRTQVGHLIKIIITYKHAFWREAGFSGEIVSDGGPTKIAGMTSGPLSIGFDATTSNGNPALVSFIGGLQHVEHSSLMPGERKNAVLAAMEEYFGPKVWEYLEYAEKDWNEEQYVGGCPVSMCQPGVMQFMHIGLRMPFHRIHFAGTESATRFCGFMNGAVQAGVRAAHEVLHNQKPHSLSAEEIADTCYSLVSESKLKKGIRQKHVIRYTLGLGMICIAIVVAKKTYFRMLVA